MELKLPFTQIPEYPEAFKVNSALGRLVDGLGFRYQWATEGLRPEDVQFTPPSSGRSVQETVAHIYNIAKMIHNVFVGESFPIPEVLPSTSFDVLRQDTLMMLSEISGYIKQSSDAELEQLTIKYTINGEVHAFPFWHLINGPISDALYHVGQIVCHRRSAGNPIDQHVEPFWGKRMVPAGA